MQESISEVEVYMVWCNTCIKELLWRDSQCSGKCVMIQCKDHVLWLEEGLTPLSAISLVT